MNFEERKSVDRGDEEVAGVAAAGRGRDLSDGRTAHKRGCVLVQKVPRASTAVRQERTAGGGTSEPTRRVSASALRA